MKTILTAKAKKAIVIRKEWPRIRDLNPIGKRLFVVDARPHGKREGYATEEEAVTRAEQLALEVENKGIEAMSFSTRDRLLASECMRKLEPLGKTIKDATDHYVSWLVSTLSDIKEALQMATGELHNLLERFFNLGGKLG